MPYVSLKRVLWQCEIPNRTTSALNKKNLLFTVFVAGMPSTSSETLLLRWCSLRLSPMRDGDERDLTPKALAQGNSRLRLCHDQNNVSKPSTRAHRPAHTAAIPFDSPIRAGPVSRLTVKPWP